MHAKMLVLIAGLGVSFAPAAFLARRNAPHAYLFKNDASMSWAHAVVTPAESPTGITLPAVEIKRTVSIKAPEAQVESLRVCNDPRPLMVGPRAHSSDGSRVRACDVLDVPFVDMTAAAANDRSRK